MTISKTHTYQNASGNKVFFFIHFNGDYYLVFYKIYIIQQVIRRSLNGTEIMLKAVCRKKH